MPPKKRDKPLETAKEPCSEQLQTDHELFLQAFEKPTQIYRYLRTRHLVSPVFLTRTLTYMRHRMSRTHKHRKNFKVDNVLERLQTDEQEEKSDRPSGHMTLTFTGFYDKTNKGSGETVTVEATLLKICHKKRKDVASPVMQISVGKCEVPRNPDLTNPPAKATAISIASDRFNLSNGHLVKSYVLLLRISCPGGKIRLNGLCNGELSDADDPPQKRRKTGKGQQEEVHHYGAELVVYDKHQRCLLTDGEYQLVLQDCGQRPSPRKMSSWETFCDGKERIQNMSSIGPFDVFNKGPLVTFLLTWNEVLLNGMVDMPRPVVVPSEQSYQNGTTTKTKVENEVNGRSKMRIFYQFLYNNNTRQQTEARDDLHCPWCSLNCLQLYCLLKHLKLCHSRFIFTYVPHTKGARVDVSINECYDGSYAGNPQDLYSQTGFAFSRTGPVRRTPVTHVMVCRPKRPPSSLSEFLEPDDTDFDGPRAYVSGHNRLYYHTGSCLPVRPQEIEVDSESENDPEWLRIKTQHMIDEFTDVNEGEKELMKMWNLHVMKYGFVGDCQIPLACSMFVDHHGKDMISKNLYKNFLLHLSNLFDFGLIGASAVYHTVHQLQELLDDSDKKPLLTWCS